MKLNHGFLVAVFLFSGCAAYKELEPQPEISPFERGYVELKRDEENFQLDEGTKYFMKFPAPTKEHFYLVLTTRAKPALDSYLSSTFEDGDSYLGRISDETANSDSMSVYAINTRVPTFYWVIDNVRYDVELVLTYRYVPQWRFVFENKFAEFKELLAKNKVERRIYDSIDRNYNFEQFNFGEEIRYITDRDQKIKGLQAELIELESIFPKDIGTSRDTAYLRYSALRNQVDEELAFQDNYITILSLFKKESETRGSAIEFLKAASYFAEIISQRDRFPRPILEKASDVFLQRLSELTRYYDTMLRSKNDINVIEPQPDLGVIQGLYRACGQPIPRDTDVLIRFIQRFNEEVNGLRKTKERFTELRTYFNSNIIAPPIGFYDDLYNRAVEIRTATPVSQLITFEKYGNLNAAMLLAQEVTMATNRANDLQTMFESAKYAVVQVNAGAWAFAESRLQTISDDIQYRNPYGIADERRLLLGQLQNDLFYAVKDASRQRADMFAKAHETTVENVSALYKDSAFVPVYQLTFSSTGQSDLVQKRKEIEGYLDQLKYFQFPSNSIKALYREFTRNINVRGVEKARAIAEHGKFYRGDDKQVKGLVDECDVNVAKWIVKPKEYRKLYALPVSSNKQGANQYMFRIRLQIPSDAEFPVFDVNIKLPQEIAENAGRQQWYDAITIDARPIKNEGRFTITSPTPDNGYESQISPVQMDKEGRNILEVRFTYQAFKVLEVSAMAQVPIIRKN